VSLKAAESNVGERRDEHMWLRWWSTGINVVDEVSSLLSSSMLLRLLTLVAAVRMLIVRSSQLSLGGCRNSVMISSRLRLLALLSLSCSLVLLNTTKHIMQRTKAAATCNPSTPKRTAPLTPSPPRQYQLLLPRLAEVFRHLLRRKELCFVPPARPRRQYETTTVGWSLLSPQRSDQTAQEYGKH